MQVIDEVVLEGCFDAVIKFSKSGKLFCLMNKTTSQLKIFSIDTQDPLELIKEIREDKAMQVLKHNCKMFQSDNQ